MELYVKSGPNGEVGDCPFAHLVQSVLNAKKLDYKVIPCNQGNKPSWLVDDPKLCGKMPCLKDGETKVIESMDIVRYIEGKYPEPPLLAESHAEQMDLLSPIFPAFAKFMKNPEFCPDREKAFLDSLQALESHLAKSKFVCGGDSPSVADYSIAPKLLHAQVTTRKFTPESCSKLSEQCPNIADYMTRMCSDSSFSKAKPADDLIAWGWGEARK